MKFSAKKGILSSITLMWMVVSCFAPNTALPPTGTPSPEGIHATPTVSPKLVQPTLTPQNQPVELSLEAGCIPIEDEIPEDLSFSGSWIRNDEAPYLENLNEGTTYKVPLEGKGLLSTEKGNMAISPDGKHLAYIDIYMNAVRHGADKRILRIIKSSGHIFPTDYWSIDWQWIIGWIDNQNLALSTGKNEVVILNPFTSEWRKFENPKWLSPDINNSYFPNLDTYEKFPSYNYAPTLNWLVIDPNYNMTEIHNIQLGDLVWQGDSDEPLWTRDGKTLGLVTKEKINVISTDGKLSEFQLNAFDTDYSPNSSISPNGKKLVVFSYPDNYAVVDIEQTKIRKVCLNGYKVDWVSSLLPWSPDSRFVIQSIYDSHYDDFDLLIDTQQMRAYKLVSGEYQHRLIWLAPP